MKNNTIKVLSDREHVLQVPSRYIGSISPTKREDWFLDDNDTFDFGEYTLVPAFITLFREIISNSVDEFIRTNGKFGNKIDVKFDGKYFTVRDNGRGLSHKIEKKTKLPQSVVAFIQLKAGSNFVDERTTTGMHGEGASLTNIFSKHFIVQTSDGIKKTKLVCKDNLLEYDYKLTKNISKFTEIKWLPDYQRLNINLDNIDDYYIRQIKKLILELSLCYQDIKFTYNSKKISINSFRQYVKKYHDVFEIFTYDNIDIAVIPGIDYNQVSFVNGIYTRLGGIHVDIVNHYLVKSIRELLIKKYKDIKPTDIKNKLFYIINVRNMRNPQFSNQVKEELINTSNDFDFGLYEDIDFEKMAKKIKSNKSILNNIIDTFKIKEELKKKKDLEKKEKKLTKIKTVPKLIETYDNDRENCRLYITEGKTATQHFLTCRESYMAAYPLKGKFINCNNISNSKLLKNKEVQDLLTSTGLKLTSQSIEDLRYGKIIIFTDADYDGDAICCLLINFFYKFWPDLIRENRLCRALTPLISAENSNTKEKRYFFSLDDFQHECENDENWKMKNYNKGLGSLTIEEYQFSLDNLITITEDNMSDISLNIAFGDDANLRKEWLLA